MRLNINEGREKIQIPTLLDFYEIIFSPYCSFAAVEDMADAFLRFLPFWCSIGVLTNRKSIRFFVSASDRLHEKRTINGKVPA